MLATSAEEPVAEERQAIRPQHPLLAKAGLLLRKKWFPPAALTMLGFVLILWSGLKLIEIFSESDEKTPILLTIQGYPECQIPDNVFVVLSVSPVAIHAFIHPSFTETSNPFTCVVVGSDRPFRILPSKGNGPGSVDLSKMPEVQKFDENIWAARVSFVPVPRPDAPGMHEFPQNKPLELDLVMAPPHPTYTTVRLDVIFRSMLSLPNLMINLDNKLALKDFDSPSNSFVHKQKQVINIKMNSGIAIFHLFLDDLSRQRQKDIFLLIAGGVLVLGLGCLVDASMKFIELNAG